MAKFVAVITKYEIIQHVVSFAEQDEAELYIKKMCSKDFDPDHRDARVFLVRRDGFDKDGESWVEEVYSYHPNDALPPEKILNKKEREDKLKQEKKLAKISELQAQEKTSGKVKRKVLVMSIYPNSTAQQQADGSWAVMNGSECLGTGPDHRVAWRDAGKKLGVCD